MSFNILYVENSKEDYSDIFSQIEKYNEDNDDRLPLSVENATDPEDLKEKLDIRHSIVLADLYYDDQATGVKDSVNRLNDIKRIVQEWSDKNNSGRPVPLIAFSRRQEQKQTLSEKDGLFDIWDKNTLSPEYVVWRLSKLAKEMSHVQPDSHLQYLIRKMINGPQWHDHVITMAKKYNAGWTEFDQIDRAGGIIEEIAKEFNTITECREMWDVMTRWESFGRAISPQTRGHSRHVINVFWLGYYLLNHEKLQDMFAQNWSDLLYIREGMQAVKDDKPLEAVNNVWFYAGLFHDVGACVEKNVKILDYYNKLYKKFDEFGLQGSALEICSYEQTEAELKDNLKHIIGPLGEIVFPIVKNSLKNKTPDHGYMGAELIKKIITANKQQEYAREAARAIVLHNVLSDLKFASGSEISWEQEPITCLLVLCDQLQTWDRERGDEKIEDSSDLPVRAELLELRVKEFKEAELCCEVSINYITKRHVETNFVIKERVENTLIKILNANPYKALEKIKKPWPFSLKAKFYLNRNYLTKLNFLGK